MSGSRGKLLQNAELIQLQSQINPHFLYNSFYLIRIMAKNESFEQIDTFVTSLAKYYRFLNKEVEQNIELAERRSIWRITSISSRCALVTKLQ